MKMKMTDLTKATTADLLAEWGNTQNHPIDNWPPNERKAAAIASELDRRCENAGISIDDGQPMFTKFDDYEIHEPEKDYCPSLESATVRIAPKELRDLLTWLLMKGGTKWLRH